MCLLCYAASMQLCLQPWRGGATAAELSHTPALPSTQKSPAALSSWAQCTSCPMAVAQAGTHTHTR